VPDVAQRLHWDPVWAQAIGNPMAYDYGVMRENYIYHYLTDWCGDDGVVVQQHDEVRKFNYMGDAQIISGEVTAKREEGGRCLVDVAVRMKNQRDEETVRATATIALPSRDGRLATFTPVPGELEQKGLSFMAKHWAAAGRVG